MNNDLISREALLNEIMKEQDKLKSDNDSVWERNRGYFKGLAWANRIIIDAPAVDLKDEIAGAYNEGYMCGNKEAEKARPQGEWIEGYHDYFETLDCSLCGYVRNERHLTLNFCPNCGAKMQEGGAE